MEDDEALARLIQRRLEKHGYAVDTAANGKDGLAMAGKADYDVVTIDYKMPGMDGLEILRALAEMEPPTPTIMVSGTGNLNVALEAIHLGAADYVIKETGKVFIDLLLNTIGTVLEHSHLIKEKEKAEEALQRSHESLTAIMDSMDSLLYISDMDTYELLFFNKYGKDIFGDLTGKICWKSIQTDQSGPCDFCTNDKLLSADGKPTGVYVWEFQNTVNGHWYECRDQAIKWLDGHIVRMENAIDITERKHAEEKIKHMAQYDMLTNLPNRALFIDRLSVALSGAKRKENKVAFLFVDLDDFKPVNDNMGHEAGDQVLKEVARRLSSCVREMDTVARFGGDEFTVALTDITSESSVTSLANKILKSLSKPYQLDGEEASLSCSIGIALYPEHGLTPDELIKCADDAMYVAKKEGKRGIRYASRQQ